MMLNRFSVRQRKEMAMMRRPVWNAEAGKNPGLAIFGHACASIGRLPRTSKAIFSRQ